MLRRTPSYAAGRSGILLPPRYSQREHFAALLGRKTHTLPESNTSLRGGRSPSRIIDRLRAAGSARCPVLERLRVDQASSTQPAPRWPSSEAHLYREQKRLVRAGWARAEEEQVGNRTRNRYWITDAGRDALRSWLATEPEPPRIEIEGILRLFFADQGEIDAANASLIATAAHARDALDVMLDMIEDYVAAGGPFPERSYPIAAVCELITEMLERIEAHALNISEEISGADTLTSCSQQRTGQEKFEAILRRAGR